MIDIKWHPSRKDLRVFGVLQIVFFAILTWMFVDKGRISQETAYIVVAVSLVVGLVGWFWLAGLRYVYLGWMLAVFPIGWLMSHLILGVLFYLVFTPVGLMMKLCGKHPLHRRFDPSAKTYWTRRTPATSTERYFKQY